MHPCSSTAAVLLELVDHRRRDAREARTQARRAMFLDDRLDQQLREPGIVLWQCYVARRQREHNRIAASDYRVRNGPCGR
jgi:hypothetical protein